jgi:hypothetical protein
MEGIDPSARLSVWLVAAFTRFARHTARSLVIVERSAATRLSC